MNLRQQIIQDHAEKAANLLGITLEEGFVRFVHSLIVGRSLHSFDASDLVEGSQDKQIDTFTIEEEADSAVVYILQMKNTRSFSSNALIQIKNGLDWIFTKTRKDLNTLSNIKFRDKIIEYRAIQSNLGPSNIRIVAGLITNGCTREVSDEFKQELKSIFDTYDNGTFELFNFQAYGCDELVVLLNSLERKNRSINADIKIKYDANNPSLIKYYAQDLKGLVCTVSAQEIGRLVNSDAQGSIFDLNIRRFLGTRGSVNKDILATCSHNDSSYEFWFLNNGITVVCDHFDAVTDPDNPHIKLTNMQIVNGCQTATTLALSQQESSLAADVRVLMRVYETKDSKLVDKIVLTTNNQNKISSRDLRANDSQQLDMEQAFKIQGYYYERKPRQFDDLNVDAAKILVNELVAQSYLSIVLKTPSDGRARKYKVWSELYQRIFGGARIEPYIVSALLARQSSEWLHKSGFQERDEYSERMLAKKGTFHIARIASYIWRGTDDWRISGEVLSRQLQILEKQIDHINQYLQEAYVILCKIVMSNDRYSSDVDRALKSSELDNDINTHLHNE